MFSIPGDGVYMYEAPPPYAGIDPNLTPYPPPQQTNGYPPSTAAGTGIYSGPSELRPLTGLLLSGFTSEVLRIFLRLLNIKNAVLVLLGNGLLL